MGTDHIEKTGRSLRKSWDRGRVERATLDLLSRSPNCGGFTAAAEVRDGCLFSVGDQLIVQAEPDGLVVRRGIHEVARFDNPPAELVDAVKEGGGIAAGTVYAVHAMAGVVEISVC